MATDQRKQDEDQMVNFEDAKAWIAVQEAYQAASFRPAPLTAIQRKALSHLKLPLTTSEAIEIGDTDWVSLILRYRDAHHRLGIKIEFTDQPSPTNKVQWLVTCNFSESAHPDPIPFPGPGTGFVPLTGAGSDPDSTGPPSFPSKRDAKQYAARCCAQWLRAQSRMPATGETAFFTTTRPPASLPGAASSPSSGSGSSGDGNGGGGDDDDPSTARRRVAELCHRMRIPPPKYELRPASEGAVGYWSGGASFGTSAPMIPDHVGRVENIYGKKMAQGQIAEQLLVYLLKMEAERKAEYLKVIA